MLAIKALASLFLATTVASVPLQPYVEDIVPRDADDTLHQLVARNSSNLSKNRLLDAMEDASSTAAAKGQTHIVIVQGGAVNVVAGDRAETGDMDFIDTQYTPTSAYADILEQLKKCWNWATQQATKRGKPIPSKWADNTIQFFFHSRPDLWSKYKSQALSQRWTLSSAGIDEDDGSGIKFIAAPVDYMFVGKMGNVGSVSHPHKPYDFKDAAFYLRKWLSFNHKQSITFTAIQAWFGAWGDHVPSKIKDYCKEINRVAGRELITDISPPPSPPKKPSPPAGKSPPKSGGSKPSPDAKWDDRLGSWTRRSSRTGEKLRWSASRDRWVPI